MNIFIIALTTLFVTVAGGIIVNYIKNIKRKIIFEVNETVPVKLENNRKIGAYVVSLSNPSSRTIKDVSVTIQAEHAKLKNGGIKSSEGMKYGINNSSEEIYAVSIPFLSSNDSLSLTVFAESENYIPASPVVTIRSPQKITQVNVVDIKRNKYNFRFIAPGLVAAISLLLAWQIWEGCCGPSQKDVLMFASNANNLPDLCTSYSFQTDITYFNQGEMLYAKAKQSRNPDEIKKYISFMDTAMKFANHSISKSGRSALFYNMAKMELLLGNKTLARTYYEEASRLKKKLVENMSKFDNDNIRGRMQLDNIKTKI